MRTITEEILADALTEWDRRYREEPERFKSEAERLLKDTPYMYGQASASYLLSIIDDQSATAPVIGTRKKKNDTRH